MSIVRHVQRQRERRAVEQPFQRSIVRLRLFGIGLRQRPQRFQAVGGGQTRSRHHRPDAAGHGRNRVRHNRPGDLRQNVVVDIRKPVHPFDSGVGRRHVDRHGVGRRALVGAVAHLEGESRVGIAAGVRRRRELEFARVEVGLAHHPVHRHRAAVVRQAPRVGPGHYLHARQRVAGIGVREVEVGRRERVRRVLVRRHRVVGRRRRGVGRGAHHDVEAVLGVQVPVTRRHLDRHRARRRRRPGKVPRRRREGQPARQRLPVALRRHVSQRVAVHVAERGGRERVAERRAHRRRLVRDRGRHRRCVVHRRHVDRHGVGRRALVGAVAHLEGESRVGIAAGVRRRRELELARVEVGLAHHPVHRHRAAVVRQAPRVGPGHYLHARQRVAGIGVREVEVGRRERVRRVLVRRHRVVGRRRRGVGRGAHHDVEAVLGVQVPVTRRHLDRHRARRRRRPGKVPRRRREGQPARQRLPVALRRHVSQRVAVHVAERGGRERVAERRAHRRRLVRDRGRHRRCVVHRRHVDRHGVGRRALVGAVAHLEGESRVGIAAGVRRRRELELARVEVGLAHHPVHRHRAAVVRQAPRVGPGHYLHARQRVAGIGVREVEVGRRERVRRVLVRRHRVVGRRRRGVGRGAHHDVEAVLGVQVPVTRRHLDRHRARRRRRPGKVPRRRREGQPARQRLPVALRRHVSQRVAVHVAERGGRERVAERRAHRRRLVRDRGRHRRCVVHRRHVDRHGVGRRALVGAVAHLEGESRVGIAAGVRRRRELELARVEVGLAHHPVHRHRAAVVRQAPRVGPGHYLHARQRVAGIGVREVEVGRRERVRRVLVRRHRVVGRRRRGVGRGAHHDVEAVLGVQVPVTRRHLDRHRARRRRRPGKVPRRRREGQPARQRLPVALRRHVSQRVAVHVAERGGRERVAERRAHRRRLVRDRGRHRRCVVHRRHVDRHGVGRRALVGAVAHLEGESRVGIAAGVRRRRELELARVEVGLAHHPVHRHRAAVVRQAPRVGPGHYLHARQRVAGIGVREVEVGRRERVRRVLVRRHRVVGRRRRGVGRGAHHDVEAVLGVQVPVTRRHLDRHRARRRRRPGKVPRRRREGQPARQRLPVALRRHVSQRVAVHVAERGGRERVAERRAHRRRLVRDRGRHRRCVVHRRHVDRHGVGRRALVGAVAHLEGESRVGIAAGVRRRRELELARVEVGLAHHPVHRHRAAVVRQAPRVGPGHYLHARQRVAGIGVREVEVGRRERVRRVLVRRHRVVGRRRRGVGRGAHHDVEAVLGVQVPVTRRHLDRHRARRRRRPGKVPRRRREGQPARQRLPVALRRHVSQRVAVHVAERGGRERVAERRAHRRRLVRDRGRHRRCVVHRRHVDRHGVGRRALVGAVAHLEGESRVGIAAGVRRRRELELARVEVGLAHHPVHRHRAAVVRQAPRVGPGHYLHARQRVAGIGVREVEVGRRERVRRVLVRRHRVVGRRRRGVGRGAHHDVEAVLGVQVPVTRRHLDRHRARRRRRPGKVPRRRREGQPARQRLPVALRRHVSQRVAVHVAERGGRERVAERRAHRRRLVRDRGRHRRCVVHRRHVDRHGVGRRALVGAVAHLEGESRVGIAAGVRRRRELELARVEVGLAHHPVHRHRAAVVRQAPRVGPGHYLHARQRVAGIGVREVEVGRRERVRRVLVRRHRVVGRRRRGVGRGAHHDVEAVLGVQVPVTRRHLDRHRARRRRRPGKVPRRRREGQPARQRLPVALRRHVSQRVAVHVAERGGRERVAERRAHRRRLVRDRGRHRRCVVHRRHVDRHGVGRRALVGAVAHLEGESRVGIAAGVRRRRELELARVEVGLAHHPVHRHRAAVVRQAPRVGPGHYLHARQRVAGIGVREVEVGRRERVRRVLVRRHRVVGRRRRGVGRGAHHDVEAVLGVQVPVARRHLHRHRARRRRRPGKAPRRRREGQPARQRQPVALRRRVGQRVAVHVAERGGRERVAERRAHRRRLVRDRGRHRRCVVHRRHVDRHGVGRRALVGAVAHLEGESRVGIAAGVRRRRELELARVEVGLAHHPVHRHRAAVVRQAPRVGPGHYLHARQRVAGIGVREVEVGRRERVRRVLVRRHRVVGRRRRGVGRGAHHDVEAVLGVQVPVTRRHLDRHRARRRRRPGKVPRRRREGQPARQRLPVALRRHVSQRVAVHVAERGGRERVAERRAHRRRLVRDRGRHRRCVVHRRHVDRHGVGRRALVGAVAHLEGESRVGIAAGVRRRRELELARVEVGLAHHPVHRHRAAVVRQAPRVGPGHYLHARQRVAGIGVREVEVGRRERVRRVLVRRHRVVGRRRRGVGRGAHHDVEAVLGVQVPVTRRHLDRHRARRRRRPGKVPRRRREGQPARQRLPVALRRHVSQRVAVHVAERGGRERVAERRAHRRRLVRDRGRHRRCVVHRRHVDRHGVGRRALVGAVAHLEGESRVGIAAGVRRRRELELARVEVGLAHHPVHRHRAAVVRQAPRVGPGHYLHARQRVAGIGVREVEVGRRERVRRVLVRRHRVVGRRRRGVGRGAHHDVEAVLGVQVPVTRRHLDRHRARRRRRPGKVPRRRREGQPARQRLPVALRRHVSQRVAVHVAERGGRERVAERRAHRRRLVRDRGRHRRCVVHRRHVDRHGVGRRALVGAVAHLEGESRVGIAAGVRRRRELELARVEVGLAHHPVHRHRAAVVRQAPRVGPGHYLHARQRVAGIGVREVEVGRRERVRRVLVRRHRVVGRRRRGVGRGAHHDVEAVLGVQVPVTRRHLDRHRARRRRRPGKVPRRRREGQPARQRLPVALRRHVSQRVAVHVAERGGRERVAERRAHRRRLVRDRGRHRRCVVHRRHVDRHGVGRRALVGAVAHLEGESRVGIAAGVRRRRELELARVEVGLAHHPVHRHRAAVVRQAPRVGPGHYLHARQRVAGIGVREVEVGRRERVRRVLVRRHRVVGRRRRGVGRGAHHDVEAVLGVQVPVARRHLHRHRARRRRRPGKAPRRRREGQPARQRQPVALRRRVSQRVAVHVAERGGRERVAERRAHRRRLVRDRGRHRRCVVHRRHVDRHGVGRRALVGAVAHLEGESRVGIAAGVRRRRELELARVEVGLAHHPVHRHRAAVVRQAPRVGPGHYLHARQRVAGIGVREVEVGRRERVRRVLVRRHRVVGRRRRGVGRGAHHDVEAVLGVQVPVTRRHLDRHRARRRRRPGKVPRRRREGQPARQRLPVALRRHVSQRVAVHVAERGGRERVAERRAHRRRLVRDRGRHRRRGVGDLGALDREPRDVWRLIPPCTITIALILHHVADAPAEGAALGVARGAVKRYF